MKRFDKKNETYGQYISRLIGCSAKETEEVLIWLGRTGFNANEAGKRMRKVMDTLIKERIK